MTAVEKLRELEAKATPGPWRSYEGQRAVAVGEWEYGDIFVWDQDPEANAALIAAARNALPALLDIAEAAQALSTKLGKGPPNPLSELIHGEWLAVREALARLKEQAG